MVVKMFVTLMKQNITILWENKSARKKINKQFLNMFFLLSIAFKLDFVYVGKISIDDCSINNRKLTLNSIDGI